MNQKHSSDLSDRFSNQIHDLLNTNHVSGWCVAFSGGLDSRVLLDLLVASSSDLPVRILHVHHGISENADDWVEFCQTTAESYSGNIEAIIERVSVDIRGSFEENARKARYQVFESTLKPNEVLLMGHHLNDQAETFLQRLARGSGLTGLSGIPKKRALNQGLLFRPLIDESREDLKSYAQRRNLHWVEDESNAFEAYDRNYLRHQILPTFIARWPRFLNSVSRSVKVISQDAENLAYYRDQWLDQYRSLEALDLNALSELPESEQCGLLSHWVRRRSGYSLSNEQLRVLLNEVIHSPQDAKAVLRVGEFEYRRFQNRLYLVPSRQHLDLSHWRCSIKLEENCSGELFLPDGSHLIFEPAVSGQRITHSQIEVCYRKGGEHFRPVGHSQSKDLKKWFQEQAIPPWQRSNIPLLYSNQTLLAVADLAFDQLCVCEDDRLGWKVVWHR
ncbi:tRNA lysidine(34) synthetase TilS [Litoribrevibacter albus]|uniref:tRNA(Ile)-lysidine synthase n=1 Tax=Litoribrevibacter albus TaxID=1473156 RepID=A0AA37S8G0_9GAMM|nr:tRNA lysidine(34) synthetase TilS [Litoribrevibacter albus]GLQ31162.1 tRNA(Ile)-lysidine synthase [Litoribrevibacter albus]